MFADVRKAECASQAVEILHAAKVDMVILDLDAVDSRQVLREAGRAAKSTPMVVLGLSWRSETNVVEEYLRAGLDCFVAKPIDAAVLRMELKRACDA